MKILVTGGAGYIGSTVASALINAGHQPVILDSLVTGRRDFVAGRQFYEGDIADGRVIDQLFTEHPDIEAVVHCAALIVVPESVREPLRYYDNNVAKTTALLGHLLRHDCRRLVFSSSASIYQPDPSDFAVDETSPVLPASPYARTKAMVESVLADVAATGEFGAVSLRYFNPIGADPRLRTGLQTVNPSHALGKMIEAWEDGSVFPVTGTDWPTRDGTGIRDYIHVWDLARAHVAAVERFDAVTAAGTDPGYNVINLGTGTGTTVRELLSAFCSAVGTTLASKDVGPRPGDLPGAYTRRDRAAALLDWHPELSIEDGIRHAMRWREVMANQ
ncbi:MAG: UDP-glucose 4-epimerase GalE [Micromonosporaceae bacterium]